MRRKGCLSRSIGTILIMAFMWINLTGTRIENEQREHALATDKTWSAVEHPHYPLAFEYPTPWGMILRDRDGRSGDDPVKVILKPRPRVVDDINIYYRSAVNPTPEDVAAWGDQLLQRLRSYEETPVNAIDIEGQSILIRRFNYSQYTKLHAYIVREDAMIMVTLEVNRDRVGNYRPIWERVVASLLQE